MSRLGARPRNRGSISDRHKEFFSSPQQPVVFTLSYRHIYRGLEAYFTNETNRLIYGTTFISGVKSPRYPVNKRLGGPQSRMDAVGKRKIPCPYWERNPCRSALRHANLDIATKWYNWVGLFPFFYTWWRKNCNLSKRRTMLNLTV